MSLHTHMHLVVDEQDEALGDLRPGGTSHLLCPQYNSVSSSPLAKRIMTYLHGRAWGEGGGGKDMWLCTAPHLSPHPALKPSNSWILLFP